MPPSSLFGKEARPTSSPRLPHLPTAVPECVDSCAHPKRWARSNHHLASVLDLGAAQGCGHDTPLKKKGPCGWASVRDRRKGEFPAAIKRGNLSMYAKQAKGSMPRSSAVAGSAGNATINTVGRAMNWPSAGVLLTATRPNPAFWAQVLFPQGEKRKSPLHWLGLTMCTRHARPSRVFRGLSRARAREDAIRDGRHKGSEFPDALKRGKRDALGNWTERHPQFWGALRERRAKQQQMLLSNGLGGAYTRGARGACAS